MKPLKIIVGVLVALAIIYSILCFIGPKGTDISRDTTIDAPADIIFSNLSDISKWEEWGTWYEQDPDMQISYSPNKMGIGAKSTWKSETLGNGSQEIIEVKPKALIKTKLLFDDWEGHSIADIILTENADQKTKVTWTLKGDRDFPFFMRGMMQLINFEGMIQNDYDTGLANLKALSEKQAKEQPITYNPE